MSRSIESLCVLKHCVLKKMKVRKKREELWLFINFKLVRYLLLHWRSNAIGAEVHYVVFIVYRVQINLFVYEQSIRLKFHLKDSSHRICKSVENALINYLEKQSWSNKARWYNFFERNETYTCIVSLYLDCWKEENETTKALVALIIKMKNCDNVE